MNCQGLADFKKRRDVFHFLRSKAFSIYLLQDTHFEHKLENSIRAEWGYHCYFASFSSNARGVAVLFNNNFEFKVNKVSKDSNGNFILISLKVMEKDFLLISLYGPNKDDPLFYNKLKQHILEFKVDYTIIGGDWNLVQNFNLDYFNYKHYNNEKAQKQVNEMMIDLDLIDIWRELNPDLKRFTWRRSSPLQQSRLDYFLVSESLLNFSIDADIIPGYRTDHSIVTISITIITNKKKPGLWKFNCSLLKDKNYVDKINLVFKQVVEEYAVFPYIRENLLNVPFSELQFVIDDQLFLDTLLMKIRAQTISYAAMKKRTNNETEKKLQTVIEELEIKTILSSDEQVELENSKLELVSLRQERMEGVLIRSRARWVGDGEKVSSFFCSLEKRNYINKRITQLNKNGNIITNERDIESEVKDFFSKLYDEKCVTDVEIKDIIDELPTFSELEQKSLEGTITLKEASIALKNMQNNKSPGSDGFTVEFFKFFWSILGNFVVRSLNEGFRKNELSSTQKEGVIVCIPKGDRPKEYIQNWRPITLLNVVYKIGSSCIANRLKLILPSIISEDQTGFMQNRYIGDNIRLIYDIIDYLQKYNKPGLLLCLDFEKAFDSLNWEFMFKVLRAFGCGPDFCRWISTFCNKIKSSVIVNGGLTSWFQVQRGCRQGDPISCYIFIMSVEIMAIMIRRNKEIKGIIIDKTEFKLSQYADDTEILLEGDENSFKETIITMEKFGKISGLVLNVEKSSAIWLGNKKNSRTVYMPHLQMDWNPKTFKILGIWFTNDLKDCIKINFDGKFLEIQLLYKTWLKRQLTPLGRVAVLKSLILSKIVFLWLLLPNPPDDFIDKLQSSIFQFIWDNKNDKISRNSSVKNTIDGGIGIPNVRHYISALKLTWIRKVMSTKHKWRYIIQTVNKKLSLIDKLGTNLKKSEKMNYFWCDVFNAYCTMGAKVKHFSAEEIGSEPLFCNSNILVGTKTIFYSEWIEKDVYCIKNLLDRNGRFLSHENFVNKYKIKVNFLTFSGCVNAVKIYLHQNKILTENCNFINYNTGKVIRLICKQSNGAKMFYDELINDDRDPNCCNKWDNRIDRNVDWKTIFHKIKKISEIQLRWMQIRIIHRIIGTNIVLSKMGVEQNVFCTFCKNMKENIQHLFFHCSYTQLFWTELKEAINVKCGNIIKINFSEHLVLFGCDKNVRTDPVLDFVIILAKSFIYRCKRSNTIPRYNLFKEILRKRYEIEKYIAIVKMKYDKHIQAWQPYKPLFIDT